jgi:hypothetical protein
MAGSMEDGSLDRFRNEARAIRERADWRIFALLGSASLGVVGVFALAIVLKAPQSNFFWPILAGLLLTAVALLWTRRTRRIDSGLVLLTVMMLVGISGVILIQNGARAPALVYGLTTVAVVLIAGRQRLGLALALWLTVWTGAVTWASATGRLSIDAPNPLGQDNARLLAFVVSTVLIGLAARIVQARRRALEAVLESALRLTEQERDAARSLAERRARKVEEISHEIRTPMTGIVGAAQLLTRQPLSPVQRQLLSIQRQSAERLLQLVTAVLDQAKVESEPMAVTQAPCAPRMLAAEVVELFAPQAHRRGVEIIWTADPALPRRVVGDAMRMRQVLSNLVSNAVKFTDHGDVQVHLAPSSPGRMRIDVRDTGRGVAPERLGAIFERFVSEAGSDERSLGTGLGLPICRDLAQAMGGRITATSQPGQGSCFSLDLPCLACAPEPADEVLPYKPPPGRLWVVGASAALATQLRFILGEMEVDARFVDGPPSADDWAAAEGEDAPRQALLVDTWTGHGRCVEQVPEILDKARRAGRRVIVVNSVAQDAAFGVLDDVWQVFRPPSWDALQEALAWAFGNPADPARGEPAPPRTLRVLLVDDNAVNQIIGKAMLDAMHAEVTVAHDGRQALDEIVAQPFDLVLMDLQMPGMDGLEATRGLRRHEREHGLARTPVLAVTGQDGTDVQRSCLEAGMDEVLVKPYTVDQLRAAIDRHAVVVAR